MNTWGPVYSRPASWSSSEKLFAKSGNVELDVKLMALVRFLRWNHPNGDHGIVLACESHVVHACDAPGSEVLNQWLFPP